MKSMDLLLVILLALGAGQGLIYGIILWRKSKGNVAANRFLGTILLFFSYRLIVEILKFFDIGFYDFWYHVLLEYNWIYGALVFFFVKASITPNFKFEWRSDLIHFLPVTIEFIWSNFIKSQNFYWDGTRESLSWLGYYGYVVWMHYPTMYVIAAILILVYVVKSQKLLLVPVASKYELFINQLSGIKLILKVLKWFSILVLAVVLIDLFFFDYAFNRWYHYPLFIGMAAITYWLGIEGFSKRNHVLFKEKIVLSEKERSQLDQIEKQLKTVMENDKLFKQPNLNIASLSEALGEKSYLISKCLNVNFEMNFSDFVNSYRIEELKRLLKDPKSGQLTLLALAFEVGFNSKASFNRSVKKLTGNSPRDLKTRE